MQPEKKSSFLRNLVVVPLTLFFTVGYPLVSALGVVWGMLRRLKDELIIVFNEASERAERKPKLTPQEAALAEADKAAKEATKASYQKKLDEEKTGISLKGLDIARMPRQAYVQAVIKQMELQSRSDDRINVVRMLAFLFSVLEQENTCGNVIRINKVLAIPPDCPESAMMKVTATFCSWNKNGNYYEDMMTMGRAEFPFLSTLGKAWEMSEIVKEYDCYQGQYGISCETSFSEKYADLFVKMSAANPRYLHVHEQIYLGMRTSQGPKKNSISVLTYMGETAQSVIPHTGTIPTITATAKYAPHLAPMRK